MNDDVFVAKGYEHIWASSGHRLKWPFCGFLIDVEARAYVRTASYAPGCALTVAQSVVVSLRARLTLFRVTVAVLVKIIHRFD